jgi:pantetheine-phosphate adenylyltransferase
VTRGHLDVIHRASRLFDHLVVAVIRNPAKTPLFSAEERVDLLRGELSGIPGVEVISFEGLTVDLARRVGASWIVRGVRSAIDAEYELSMAHSNRVCGPLPVETVLVPSSPDVAFVASRLVREIAAGGGKLRPFVTPAVEAAMRRKLAGRSSPRPDPR